MRFFREEKFQYKKFQIPTFPQTCHPDVRKDHTRNSPKIGESLHGISCVILPHDRMTKLNVKTKIQIPSIGIWNLNIGILGLSFDLFQRSLNPFYQRRTETIMFHFI